MYLREVGKKEKRIQYLYCNLSYDLIINPLQKGADKNVLLLFEATCVCVLMYYTESNHWI